MTDDKPQPIPIADYVAGGHVPGSVWLAGYPRSGVTLLRTILANLLGCETLSIYNETDISEAHRAAVGAVPQANYQNVSQLVELRDAQIIVPVKTHELPRFDNRAPAIVVVRDGRHILDSALAFCSTGPDSRPLMGDLLRGHPWGSWSKWIKSWSCVPNTMWVHYEQMVRDPHAVALRIAERFSLPAPSGTMPEFAKLHDEDPQMFRKAARQGHGSDMLIEEEKFFWDLHGDAMEMLGYESNGMAQYLSPHETYART